MHDTAELSELYLEPGGYSLYTVPGPDRSQVVVTRSTRQWGLEVFYDETLESQEVGRFTVPAERLDAPVETLTFRPTPIGGDTWSLDLTWEQVRIRIPLRAVTDAPAEEAAAPADDVEATFD